MVYACKKLSDITLQNPSGSRVIARDFSAVLPEPIHSAMRALAAPARIRIKNEFPVKIRAQNPVEHVMNKPIPNTRLVNVARLWIVYLKCQIRPVPIGLFRKLPMKCKNVVHKVNGKLGDVFAFSLAVEEFSPSGKQIFHRNDSMISMTTIQYPPPPPQPPTSPP